MSIDDASAAVEQMGVHNRRCGPNDPHAKGRSPCVEGDFRLVPLQTPGEPLEPVKAWVHCADAKATTDAECGALVGALDTIEGRVLWRFSEGTSGWNKAIAASGLTSAKRAPVIIME